MSDDDDEDGSEYFGNQSEGGADRLHQPRRGRRVRRSLAEVQS